MAEPTASERRSTIYSVIFLEMLALLLGLLIGIQAGKHAADRWWWQHTTANGVCGCYMLPQGVPATMRERK